MTERDIRDILIYTRRMYVTWYICLSSIVVLAVAASLIVRAFDLQLILAAIKSAQCQCRQAHNNNTNTITTVAPRGAVDEVIERLSKDYKNGLRPAKKPIPNGSDATATGSVYEGNHGGESRDGTKR